MATKQDNDVLDIADLEYDVGAIHSAESGDGQDTNEMWVIYYTPPV